MLKINEIFFSIQGEGSNQGRPCVFIRLTGCNLRCAYCDTSYAFSEGTLMSTGEIFQKIKSFDCKLIEITGGEPLMQNEVTDLMDFLCEKNYEIMIETNGSRLIDKINKQVKIILDFKCPSSGMFHHNNFDNLKYLKQGDDIKFVIGDRNDFEWASGILKKYELQNKYNVLFSTVFKKLPNHQLAKWILDEKLDVKMHLQLHKYIWEPDRRGV